MPRIWDELFYRCTSGRAIVSGVGKSALGTVCYDDDRIPSEWVIEVNDPQAFLSYIDFLNKWTQLSKLIDIYIKYDLPQLVSTHNAMDRRVERLRKLIKLLRNSFIDIKSYEGTCYSVSLADLMYPIITELDEIVKLLEMYKNSIHRIRDRVHSYVYPYLRQLLEALMDPMIFYSPYWWLSDGIRIVTRISSKYDKRVEFRLYIKKRNFWNAYNIGYARAKEICKRHKKRLINHQPPIAEIDLNTLFSMINAIGKEGVKEISFSRGDV